MDKSEIFVSAASSFGFWQLQKCGVSPELAFINDSVPTVKINCV